MLNKTSFPFWGIVKKEDFVETIFARTESTLKTVELRKRISEIYDEKAWKIFIHADADYNSKNPTEYKFDVYQGFKPLERNHVVKFTSGRLNQHEINIHLMEIVYRIKLQQ